MKKHLGFILFFSAIIFIFLGEIIFIKKGFLNGDYLTQFYPWSKVYSEAIKNFSFPFWIRYVNSGFPLMAEGQIGGFYPINIIMYFFLPFKYAYNYSVILHFMLGGVFTYIYTRKIGADQWGACLSALIFCFGSTFAGYPYIRTLIWFPLGLFVIEKYFADKKLNFSIYLGIILGLQFLAGFVQVAIYSAGFYFLYFVYGLIIRKNLKVKDILKFLLALLTCAILFSPQAILSLKIAGLSVRTQSTLGFALWGSFSPLSFVSLYFPSLIFSGSQLYVGVVTLIFPFFALGFLKKEVKPLRSKDRSFLPSRNPQLHSSLGLKPEDFCEGLKLKPIFAIFLAAIFFALGAYNPICVFFLKITQLYTFRNPSKFIFFAGFALAALSGVGFSKFFETKGRNHKIRVLNIFSFITAFMLIVFSLARIILYCFKDKIINMGSWYVTNYVFGKSYHRYGVENYLERVKIFYERMLAAISFSGEFIIFSLLLCMVALWVARLLAKDEKQRSFQKIAIIGIISIDIFIFSFYGAGFMNNIKTYDSIRPTHNKILNILQTDKELFRIMPFGLVDKNMPWWVRPSANILVGIDSVASYTPLAQKSYRTALTPFEVVDDSLGLLYPDPKALDNNYDTYRILNVKYIIAPQALTSEFLEEITAENGIYLYRVKGYLPRIFFVSSLDGAIKRNKNVSIDITKYGNGHIEVDVNFHKGGFVVFSENFYPGWEVYVDGEKKENLEFKNLVQAVKVEKGKHKIVFKYLPF